MTPEAINIILICLTIIGWLAAFWFGIKQQRLNIKDSAKLKVYEDLSKKYEEFQNSAIELTTKFLIGFPMSLIESERDMPKRLLQLKKITDSQKIFLAEIEGKQKAFKRANDYVTEVREVEQLFSKSFLEFWKLFETWSALTPSLKNALRVLVSEYTTLSKRIHDHIFFLITLDKYNSEKWNKSDIDSRNKQIWEDTNEFSVYVVDFMALIHNELVTPLLGHTKEIRRTRDPKLKVLTKGGLTIRVETDMDVPTETHY